jgi:hypothetical protein
MQLSERHVCRLGTCADLRHGPESMDLADVKRRAKLVSRDPRKKIYMQQQQQRQRGSSVGGGGK